MPCISSSSYETAQEHEQHACKPCPAALLSLLIQRQSDRQSMSVTFASSLQVQLSRLEEEIRDRDRLIEEAEEVAKQKAAAFQTVRILPTYAFVYSLHCMGTAGTSRAASTVQTLSCFTSTKLLKSLNLTGAAFQKCRHPLLL